jgi:hypothetical protein
MEGSVAAETEAWVKSKYFQPLDDRRMESQALDLAERFDVFQNPRRERDSADSRMPFRREGWKKTFRIMLANDRRNFHDVALVVDSLRTYQDHIDTCRYRDAFRVRKEFDQLLDHVMCLRDAGAKKEIG